MNAKAYMMQVKKVEQMITNKQMEIDHYFSKATSTSSGIGGERVQSSPNPNKMTDAVDRYIELQKQINEDIDRLIDIEREVIKKIELLPLVEYDVLHKMYFQDLTFWDVADAYDRNYSWATTTHGRALKHLQEILDKEEDDG